MPTNIYEVKPGQSLSIIARDVLGDINRWKELAILNGLQYPYIVKIGQLIKLPPKDTPLVIEVKGEMPKPVASAPTIKLASFSSPATVIMLVVGALVLFGGKK